MRITECRAADVVLLEQHLIGADGTQGHAEPFSRHQEGSVTHLVAWRDQWPVGTCEVRWQGCPAAEVRRAHPRCPEIVGLDRWPEALRSPAVGTALIRAAEALARERRTGRLGLGVENNNPRAEALYARLGFRRSVPYLHCWHYRDAAGMDHQVADVRTFMVKRLRPRPLPWLWSRSDRPSPPAGRLPDVPSRAVPQPARPAG